MEEINHDRHRSKDILVVAVPRMMMDWDDRGGLVIIAGVVLFILVIATSFAFAPVMGIDSEQEKMTLVGSQGGGPGWHEYGSIYLLEGGEQIWREASASSYFDVTVLENGNVLVGFMNSGYSNCELSSGEGVRTGFRIIKGGEDPKVVEEYSFEVRTGKDSEVHAVSMLPSGEFLISDMDLERIFTVKGGEVTWSWEARTVYDEPKDPTKRDWLHINDVDVIGEDRYLVSVRNANQILIIDRNEGVVEIINKDYDDSDDASCKRMGALEDTDGDGNIRCGDPSILNHQHNPQWLGEGKILVADSDNDRIVELHRGESGKWEPVWALYEAGGIDLNWPRDADKLPSGNILITDTLNKRIIEVDPQGKIVWGVWTQFIPYEADRLPYGEINGIDDMGESNQIEWGGVGLGDNVKNSEEIGEIGSRGSGVPIISDLLFITRVLLPEIPYWFKELQLIATIISVTMVGAGWKMRRRSG